MRRNTLILCLAAAAAAYGQNIVSAKAGLIHLAEGDVFLNGTALSPVEHSQFQSMKERDLLATEEGRAEVLLQPGGFLRIAEHTSFQLTKATFETTRVKVVSGSILIELDAFAKDISLRVEVQGREISLRKRGLYEFNSAGAGMARVYEGELTVAAVDGLPVNLKDGQEMAFTALKPAKFTKDDTTALFRWGARRARTLAAAAGNNSAMFYPSTFSLNAWSWSGFCDCYYYRSIGSGYTPYRSYIYVAPPAYSPSMPASSLFNDTMSPAAAVAVSSGTVTAGGSDGGSAMPAASAPAVSSANTSDRRR
jgi:hypothetical protein